MFVYPDTLSTFNGDREIAIGAGYIEISNEAYADLVETKKMWQNSQIVDDPTYEARKEQERKEQEAKERADAIKKQITDLKYWFDHKYRMYNEMLQRYEALGISETISDTFRKKEYKTISELYIEAEVVRAEIQALEN